MIQQICIKRRTNYGHYHSKKIRYSYDDPITRESLKYNFKNIDRWAPTMSFIRTVNDVIDENVI